MFLLNKQSNYFAITLSMKRAHMTNVYNRDNTLPKLFRFETLLTSFYDLKYLISENSSFIMLLTHIEKHVNMGCYL